MKFVQFTGSGKSIYKYSLVQWLKIPPVWEMMHSFEGGNELPGELDMWMNEGYIRNDPKFYIQVHYHVPFINPYLLLSSIA